MIRAMTYLDTWSLSVALYRMKPVFDSEAAKDGEGNTRIIPLTNEMLKHKDWVSAKSVTARALNMLAPMNGGVRPDLAGVSVEKLMPGGKIPWGKLETKNLLFHVAVVTNPGAMIYSGVMGACIPVGQLAQISTDMPYSALNLGNEPRYHLVMEIKDPKEGIVVPGPTHAQ